MNALRPIPARVASGLAFLAWVAAMAWLLLSGQYVSFLAPSFWVLLLFAILILLAFAAVRLSAPPRPHGPTSQRLLKAVIVLLPLAFLLAMRTPEAGSYAFDKRSGIGTLAGNGGPIIADAEPDPSVRQSAATGQDIVDPRFSRRPEPVTLSQIHERFASLVHGPVVTIGMVNLRKDLPNDTIVLFRFTLSCCAADAQPVAILVTHKGAAAMKKDTWVRVEGILGSAVYGSERLPVIRADKIDKIARPYNPYIN